MYAIKKGNEVLAVFRQWNDAVAFRNLDREHSMLSFDPSLPVPDAAIVSEFLADAQSNFVTNTL